MTILSLARAVAAGRSFSLLIWRGCVSAFCGRRPVQGASGKPCQYAAAATPKPKSRNHCAEVLARIMQRFDRYTAQALRSRDPFLFSRDCGRGALSPATSQRAGWRRFAG
jgi:hypothetical protein